MKKKFSGTEIVGKLRRADVLIGQGISFSVSFSTSPLVVSEVERHPGRG
jgi:hypothetical protein